MNVRSQDLELIALGMVSFLRGRLDLSPKGLLNSA